MNIGMRSLQQVKSYIDAQQQPQGYISCELHGNQCSKYALTCCYNTAKASYKTYALVYIFQILTNSKKIRQNPKTQIPKIIFNYIKSVSFTAVDMMIMRRVMCAYNKYISGSAKSLIISNILGGLYLGVQSKNRQVQITLYAFNKALQICYNAYKRRNPSFNVPFGDTLLFALSIAIISYHYFNNRQVIRPAYEKAFGTLFKNS